MPHRGLKTFCQSLLASIALLVCPAPPALGQDDPLLRAKTLVEMGQKPAAINLLDNYLKTHPDSADGWLQRSQLYEKTPAGIDAALADVTRCLKIAPRNMAALEYRGLIEVSRENWDKAEADFNLGLEAEPDRGDFLCFRGYCRYNRGEYKTAVADYSRSIEVMPDDHSTWNFRAEAWRELSEWDKAIADFTQAIRLSPNQSQYWLNRGRVRMTKGEHRLAVADFSVAIENNPQDPVAWNYRSIAYLRTGQWAYGHRDADQSVKLLPGDPHYLSVRGIAAGRLGRTQEALADFSAALELQSDHQDALRERGLIYSNLGNWPLAEADFRRLVQANPKSDDGWNHLAVSLWRQMKFDDSISAQTRAIELEPQNSLYWRNRGTFAADLGRWKDASADYARCLALETSSTGDFYEAALVAIALADDARLSEIAGQTRQRFGKETSIEAAIDRAAIALFAGTDDDLRALLPSLLPTTSNEPVRGQQAILGSLTHIRLQDVAAGLNLLEALESLPATDQAAADGATALALARSSQVVEARARIDAGLKRLEEVKPPSMPPPAGYRTLWQGRVFAKWVLSLAESAL